MQIAYFIFGLELVHLLDINVAQCIRTLHGHSALNAEPCYHGYRDYQVVLQISDRVVGKNAQIAAFELLNEITSPETAQIWNRIAERTVKAIRRINTDVRIIIGGIYNSSIYGLQLLDKPYDENIVFTFHSYSPMIFTHQSAYWVENMPGDLSVAYPENLQVLRKKSQEVFGNSYDGEFGSGNKTIDSSFFDRLFAEAVAVSEKYNVPLYCGEYGVIDRADPECTLRWFEDIHAAFEKYDIARAVWTYKEKDFGISGKHYNSIAKRLVKLL